MVIIFNKNCIEFHKIRNNYLSLAGASRSATICIAYVMVVTDLSFIDAMNSVKGAREIVEPNESFKSQLESFEKTNLIEVCLFEILLKQ